MSSDAPHDPPGTTSAEPQTEVQPTESVDSSVEISLPAAAVQNASAPVVQGYVLTELLGQGAYGQVWRAWQRRTRKEVAVKVFMQRSGLDWIFLQREVERLLRLDRHHNVVTLLDADLSGEPPYYVIDLLEGGSLAQFVSPESRVSQDTAASWMGDICDALSYVHGRGLIHCDLKPANLLLDEQDSVRVVDFGQSRVFTESAASLGTLFYMPPEQAMVTQLGNPAQPDVRWDVYALGGTVYSVLTGRVPHATPENHAVLEQAETLEDRLTQYRDMIGSGAPTEEGAELEQHVDREFAAVVTKCMAPNADERYNNMTEIMADLQAIKDKRPVSPLASDKKYRARKFVQRNPIAVALAVVALLLVGSFFVTASLLARSEVDRADSILKAFFLSPDTALSDLANASSRRRALLAEAAAEAMFSPASKERVMAVRGVPWLGTKTLGAFWSSVNDGPLWSHGEWLALCDAPAPEPDPVLASLESKAVGGTDHEKYVAFCVMGQRYPEKKELGAMCAQAAGSEADPGVAMAASWAAGKLGAAVTTLGSDRIHFDPHTNLVFARIPASDAFRPGSPATEEERHPSEDPSETPVAIPSIWVSVTELTLGQVRPWYDAGLLAGTYAEHVARQLQQTSEAEQAVTAVHWIRPIDAGRFCEWLTDEAKGKRMSNRYRLPTEAEWEYACRGAHATAFCYGDGPDYLGYFAVHGGVDAPFHVGTKMPNAYGLFDMHGNVWEICSSPWRECYDDPEPADGGLRVVQRGGAIHNPAKACRCAIRNFLGRNRPKDRTGFRIVLEMEASP